MDFESGPLHVSRTTSDIWIGGARWDTGDSLLNESDDFFTDYEQESVRSMAQDPSGFIWLGYEVRFESDDSEPLLRRLDDGGTPHDRSDDTWLDFTFVDEGEPMRAMDLQIDGYGWKWIRTGVYSGELMSLNDQGTPDDPADDTWKKYGVGDRDFLLDDDAGVWVTQGSSLGYLEVARD